MKTESRQILKDKYYANIAILSSSGTPLSTISEKRAKWYLKKNLAEEVVPPPYPYPRALRLNFHHNPNAVPVHCDLLVCEDKCVLCGDTNKLSLHHVIPHVIRRHFPLEHKEHAREWCVLLCNECHDLAEKVTQPLYRMDFPNHKKTYTDFNVSLQVIKRRGNIDKIPKEKLEMMLSKSDYKTVDDIPLVLEMTQRQRHYSVSARHRKVIEEWAHKFVSDHGGIDGVKKYFSEIFLSMNPKYLPPGYLEMEKYENSFI